MSISQLSNGSYRVRYTINGVHLSANFKHYPTDQEIKDKFTELIVKKQNPVVPKRQNSFKECAEEYIRLKSDVLSVTTISGYKGILRRMTNEFKRTNLESIDSVSVQKEINICAANHSPKTVRNVNGFIRAVIGLFAPQTNISITLPQKHPYEPYIPVEADVKAILNYMKEHAPQYYLPLALASLGLRRSELLCITDNDVILDDSGNYLLLITKGLVKDSEDNWQIKTTKTYKSNRKILIPKQIAEQIKSQGYVYLGHPDNINKYLSLAEEKLGIPHFSLHKLRHFYITTAHYLGIPDVDIAETVGHSDTSTTRKVYTHSQRVKTSASQNYTADYLTKTIF